MLETIQFFAGFAFGSLIGFFVGLYVHESLSDPIEKAAAVQRAHEHTVGHLQDIP